MCVCVLFGNVCVFACVVKLPSKAYVSSQSSAHCSFPYLLQRVCLLHDITRKVDCRSSVVSLSVRFSVFPSTRCAFCVYSRSNLQHTQHVYMSLVRFWWYSCIYLCIWVEIMCGLKNIYIYLYVYIKHFCGFDVHTQIHNCGRYGGVLGVCVCVCGNSDGGSVTTN